MSTRDTAGKAAHKKRTSSKGKATHTTAHAKTTNSKTGTRGKKKTAASSGASGLKVRMYRVGFGDFFLVTVPTSAGDQFILIDCGVFKGTTGKGDIGSIEEAVEDLFTTTNGKLALVIMTHRHADHIAGFSRTERFKDFKASMVWMPYWEQFNDKKDSAHSLQFDISELAAQLAIQFRGRTDKDAQQALDQLSNATGIDFNAAPGVAKKGGTNAKSLDLLKNHLGDNGKNVRYYAAGDKPELPPELEGLSAVILGPPPKEAKAFMPLTDFKKGVGQYLDSITPSETGAKAINPFKPHWCADLNNDYPAKDRTGHFIKYQDVIKAVDNSQPDLLVAAADKIETFLNNQSLVVLFNFAGKNLLFVGDAQAGNWEHWLYKLDTPTNDPTKAGSLTEESQQILKTIDFYKVGHHGSTNSTPIPVVDALGKDHSVNGFVSMCSTQFGVYGKTSNNSEVPRAPLMKALGDECALVRSDSFTIKTGSGDIPPAEGAAADLPVPKVGKLIKENLYVEYLF